MICFLYEFSLVQFFYSGRKTIIMATTKKATKVSENSMLLDFFKDELKDIYWAENHLVKELPKMAKAATNKDLQKAFTDHLSQTKEHVKRLQQVFKLVGEKPVGKKCEAMDGITKECAGIIEDTKQGTSTRDVGLIFGAQKVEHYEISTYGGLSYVAQAMGLENVVKILEKTLSEERDADNLLSRVAVFQVNNAAMKEKMQ
ncbi:MAG: ferritin-like domain-containing protein [Ferruginibacter sp.]